MGPGRSITRAVLTVALVAVLIANPMGMAAVERSSPVGDAAANDHTFAEQACGQPLTYIMPAPAIACTLDTVRDAEVAESHYSIYSQALSMYTASQTYRDTFYNAMLASNDTVFLQGEMATVESYVANLTKQESQANAVENVTQYVTIRQKNLISAWNTRLASLQNLHLRDESVSGEQLTIFTSDYDPSNSEYISDSRIKTFGMRNVTLADGSTKEVRTVTFQIYQSDSSAAQDGGWLDTEPVGVRTGNPLLTYENDQASYTVDIDSVYATSPPDTSYVGSPALRHYKWAELWDRTVELNSSAVSEMQVFVEATWGEYQTENVTAQDLLSRLNLMENYQVNVGENATFNDVVAALAASGFSSPAGSTGWMNMTYVPEYNESISVTTEGMLLSSNSPENESWQIGKQYHSDNVSGLQMVATLDGQQHTINGTFTLNSVYNADGEQQNVTSVSSPDKDYRVSTVSELNDQIVLLGEEIARLEDMLATDGGGGGDGGIEWSWPEIPDLPLTEILVGGAVILVLFAVSILKP